MQTIAVLKLLTIVGTAAGGIYGTLFDFKKHGRVTRHGKLAIAGILLSVVLAVWIHVVELRDLAGDRLRLQAENDRQQLIFSNTQRLNTSLEQTRAALFDLQRNISSSTRHLDHKIVQIQRVTGALDQGVKAASASAQAQLSETRAETRRALAQLHTETEAEFARLSHPLRRISVSYDVIYEDADRRFPEYYARLLSIWKNTGRYPDRHGVYRHYEEETMDISPGSPVFPENPKPGRSGPGWYLNHESALISFTRASDAERTDGRLQYVLEAWHPGTENSSMVAWSSEPLQIMPGGGAIGLSVDFRRRLLRKHIIKGAVRLWRNDATFTSQLDLVDPSSSTAGAYIRIMRRPQDDKPFLSPRIADLVIYLDDLVSYHIPVSESTCQIVPRKVWQDAALLCPVTP